MKPYGTKKVIWPRILQYMAQENTPMSCLDIGLGLKLGARAVYASMSSLGARKGRPWIQPAPGFSWQRRSPFVLTPEGREKCRSFREKKATACGPKVSQYGASPRPHPTD